MKLIRFHDYIVEPTAKSVKRLLNHIGEDLFYDLLEVRCADILSQSLTYCRERLNKVNKIEEMLARVILEKQCFTVKDLNIDGNILMSLGIPANKELGNILNALLQEVIDEKICNDKESLIERAKEMWENI